LQGHFEIGHLHEILMRGDTSLDFLGSAAHLALDWIDTQPVLGRETVMCGLIPYAVVAINRGVIYRCTTGVKYDRTPVNLTTIFYLLQAKIVSPF
jgi:hypothetical protein